MDEFDFEELIAHMFDVSDVQRSENPDILEEKLYEKFGLDWHSAFEYTKALLSYTPTVKVGMEGKVCHAFLNGGLTLMRKETT